MTGDTLSDRLVPPTAPGKREVLRQALADAVHYRDPPLQCPGCDTSGGLCARCAAGLAQARAYLAPGHDLGLDVPA